MVDFDSDLGMPPENLPLPLPKVIVLLRDLEFHLHCSGLIAAGRLAVLIGLLLVPDSFLY